ncbi:MAG: UDP-3-O-(3-hydroxymyristoyl)glucosamine N-acyltransferase [Acidobacteria bacterium]|nr:UDP-3-O-(3-hydroxymyristoyl)glucosamine N-acyltransferase [Acidobacteriota bacterium]MCL5288276.1 UDP-3-O-(3-hydroxymyristoyl)glucosamine N-acyltransferase [Acidobacteriota bacterium]
MKLSEIARRLGCQLDGNGDLEITGVAGINEAQAGQLTFLANRKYAPAVKTTRASAIVIAKDAAPVPLAALRSGNPYLDFARAIEFFYQPPKYAPGIHPTAVVSPKAKIGDGAHIGPYCFVEDDVQIGRNAVLHSFVAIYRGARIGDDFFAHSHSAVREYCQVGNRVILQNGVVVGSDGFGFAKQTDGRWYKMQQSGTATIEDDVEIQAGSCVDRATIGETRVRRGAKLDNLVQVGHASTVGADSLLCGQVGLAGSTVVGNRCILAGQVGAAGHLEIGDGAILTAQSGVPADVPAGKIFSGYPSMDNKQWLKCVAAFNHLPELVKTVRELKSELGKLQR